MPLSMYMWCSKTHFPLYCVNISLFDYEYGSDDIMMLFPLCTTALLNCSKIMSDGSFAIL